MDLRIFLSLVILLLTGCSTSGTSIQIGEGGDYAPSSPEKVFILLAPPEKPHKVIALVEGVAATDDYFTKAKTEAAALNAMREEAARIGAHAIVLTGKGSAPYGQTSITNTSTTAVQNYGSISAFSTSTSSNLGWEKITFSGTAIRYEDGQ